MISHDQLAHAIEQELGLKHGVDFLVAHPLDKDGNQRADAYLFRWMNKDVLQPDIELMKARYQECHCDTYEAMAARERRDALIAQTDWTQAQDIPDAVKAKYAVYRQALRDITSQAGFPKSIDWPLLPQ
ncbi:hypothetical protein ABH944_002489 [Caballeronia udeis]|uniref:Phage tail assembly chaperone-like domain-containing protein n=1 Tax=Caballeronia udeis TaxID=1232866 RepID=A0A158GA59_9BURK|nr:tail fiber assembly protein [Caballeronia udeis]SAL28902.1 hypothetical protein AWB69_02263 [Caballeronia udeis]